MTHSLPQTLRGASLYIAVGQWAKPRVQRFSTGGWRICIGWLSLAAFPQDIDIAAILRALGISDHARPISPHAVVHEEIIPAIGALRDALRRYGRHAALCTKTPRVIDGIEYGTHLRPRECTCGLDAATQEGDKVSRSVFYCRCGARLEGASARIAHQCHAPRSHDCDRCGKPGATVERVQSGSHWHFHPECDGSPGRIVAPAPVPTPDGAA